MNITSRPVHHLQPGDTIHRRLRNQTVDTVTARTYGGVLSGVEVQFAGSRRPRLFDAARHVNVLTPRPAVAA